MNTTTFDGGRGWRAVVGVILALVVVMVGLALPIQGADTLVVAPQTVSGASTFSGPITAVGTNTFNGPVVVTNVWVLQPQLVSVPTTVTNWLFTNPIVVLGLTNNTSVCGIKPWASNQWLTLVNPGYGAYTLTLANLDTASETNPLYRINSCMTSNLVFTNGSVTLWYGISNRWRVISRNHNNF